MSDDVDPLPPDGPTTVDMTAPSSALVIVAHPDDAEFQCGATLAKWARGGTEVRHLVLTDGSKGTWDPDKDPGELVEERHSEQRAAATVLGAGEPVFLDLVDGELATTTETRGMVAAVIRRLRPQVVLGHDPWKRYRLHPDHHAAGRLCVEGIVAARDPGFHRDQLDAGLSPHRPDALLLFEADTANHAESVDEDCHVIRLRALEAFASQIATTHLYKTGGTDKTAATDTSGGTVADGHEPDEPLDEWRRRERRRLEGPGRWARTDLAEPFRLIVDQL